MAQEKDRKPRTGGAASPARKPAAKPSSARPSPVRTETLAEKKPGGAKKPTAKKSSSSKKTGGTPAANAHTGHRAPAADRHPAGKQDAAQQTARMPRRHTFALQYMPYLLLALALFLMACFICNAIGDAQKAEDHLMGVVGYYICYFLLGLFGWAAYLVPLLLCVMVALWRPACEDHLITVKAVLSVILLVLVSAFIHVGLCTADASLASTVDPLYLYKAGAKLESGGVIGGLLGFLLHRGLRMPGTIVLAVITMPLVVMCLFGVTPMYVYGKLQEAVQARRERRAEELAARRAEEEALAESDAAPPTESYRARRAREAAEAEAAAARPTSRTASPDTSEPIEEAEPTRAPSPAADEPTRRTVTVDTETGEVLEEAPPPAKEGKPRRTRRDDPVEEEIFAPLPLHEPTPSSTAASAPAADEPTDAVEVVAARKSRSAVADGDLHWEDPEAEEPVTIPARPLTAASLTPVAPASLPDPEPLPEEPNIAPAELPSPEDGAVELAEDVELFIPTAPADPAEPAVNFAVVTDGQASPPVHTDRQLDVVLHKQETAAVMAEGLGESEIVLPTTTLDIPVEPTKEYMFPPLDVLTRGPSRYETNDAEIAENTVKLRGVLESFRIGVQEIACSCGPTITRFEVKPDSGIRVRSIVNLVDDISMGLAKGGVRIEAPIPGKSAVGIEVPNASPATVYLRNILETPEFRNHKSRIAACLGADVAGRPVIFDIQTMPHMLIAGATGTGKSVCINSIIMSILYKANPDEVKLILIDPKKVEFAIYRDLPHLYAPVVSDPKKAAGALNSAVNEMERRFELIEEVGVRNIAGYNKITEGDPERPPIPQMVIIIDELADLMMTAPAEVETAICRLAQKARAAGIHLVVGTQRPSVDVITGLIKANIPSRIAFAVSSAIDSKIILESTGADKLIGRGDMLFSPIGANKPIRVQGAFVSEAEVEQVITFIKEHNEKGTFNEDFTREIDIEAARCGMGKKRAGEQMSIEECDALGMASSGEDPKFWDALEVAVGQEKIGTSALQRKLNLGYGRAAKIIDRMEELGFVGPDPGTKQGRKVMITAAELTEYKINGLPSQRPHEED